MFLLDLRHRIQRRLANRAAWPTEKHQRAATAAREHRAERVVHLQSEVHRLQLEIAALNQAQPGNAVTGTNGATAEQMGTLQTKLAQAQQELAKLQGRV